MDASKETQEAPTVKPEKGGPVRVACSDMCTNFVLRRYCGRERGTLAVKVRGN